MSDLVVLSMNIANLLTANPAIGLAQNPSLNTTNTNAANNSNPLFDLLQRDILEEFQRRQRVEAFKPDLINPNINYESLFFQQGSNFSFSPGPDTPANQNQNGNTIVTRFETVTEIYSNTEGGTFTQQRGNVVDFEL